MQLFARDAGWNSAKLTWGTLNTMNWKSGQIAGQFLTSSQGWRLSDCVLLQSSTCLPASWAKGNR
jgi:hypothetical protein